MADWVLKTSYQSLFPWYDCHGWLGVKNQLSVFIPSQGDTHWYDRHGWLGVKNQLSVFIPSQGEAPWYDRHGWLGVKNQFVLIPCLCVSVLPPQTKSGPRCKRLACFTMESLSTSLNQVNRWNGRWYQHVIVCPSLVCFLTVVLLKGLALWKFVFHVCACMFCFIFVLGLVLWT